MLAEIGAGDIPEVLVLNKIDEVRGSDRALVARRHPGSVPVSALTGEGIEGLVLTLDERLPHPPVEVVLTGVARISVMLAGTPTVLASALLTSMPTKADSGRW